MWEKWCEESDRAFTCSASLTTACHNAERKKGNMLSKDESERCDTCGRCQTESSFNLKPRNVWKHTSRVFKSGAGFADAVTSISKAEQRVLAKHHKKSLEVCRTFEPRKGSKYVYVGATCIAESGDTAYLEGLSSNRSRRGKFTFTPQSYLTKPASYAVCTSVRYRCVMQIAMDGRACSVKVKSQGSFKNLAMKAQLPHLVSTKQLNGGGGDKRSGGPPCVAYGRWT